jgi:hypothetical protein
MLPFFFVQSKLHLEIKLFFLLLLRRDKAADLAFYITFFPGILIHETSHWLAAKVLRVPTGRFSLVPRNLPNGKLRLGYVETQKTDWFRDALIGAAPLLFGILITFWLGNLLWNPQAITNAIVNGDPQSFGESARTASQATFFWIWFYLVFTITSMMMPSESDRKSWLPALLVFVGILLIPLVLGAGDWMQTNLLPILNNGLLSLTTLFFISLVLHVVLLIPVWLFRAGIERLVGYP